MTQFAQGSLTLLRLSHRWLRAVCLFIMLAAMSTIALHSLAASAQEADRVVIRGPQGSESSQVRRGTEQYGPIKATDTLWSIANRHRPHSSVTVPQMMAAIVQANQDAFRNGNANEMLTGFYLRIPSLEEVQQLNPEAAQVQVKQAELIARQQRVLAEEESLLQQHREEQQRLIEEARAQAEAAVQEVQNSQTQSFNELQQTLLRSIESTEALYQDNMELKERLTLLEEALTAMQEDVVTAEEYEAEITKIKAEQAALRQAQTDPDAASGSMLDDLLEQPSMIILLASVPALLMILLTTWLLRRRQIDMAAHELLAEEPSERVDEPELTDDEARDALERELMGGVTVDEELGTDDPFADFADEEDEGTDLDRLSDEMLKATEDDGAEDEAEIGEEAEERDDFTALDEDVSNSFEAESEVAFEEDDADLLVPLEDDEVELKTEEPLDQDDLDALLETAQQPETLTLEEESTEETEDVTTEARSEEPIVEGSEEESLEQELDTELLPDDSETLDPLDPDVALDQTAQQREQKPADLDVDELLDELGIQDENTDVDDIDALLEQTQALEDEVEAPQEDDFVFDDEQPEQDARAEASFLDIDEILADVENTAEPDDSATEDDSSRAEDQLAAKLDLARAYLEMGDTGSALEAIQEALASTDISIREEAEELKKRIESES